MKPLKRTQLQYKTARSLRFTGRYRKFAFHQTDSVIAGLTLQQRAYQFN